MSNKVLIGILSLILVVLVIIGTTYAYFSANIEGAESSETITATGGLLTIVMNGGSAITVNGMSPREEAIATKTITLTGTNTTSAIMPYTMKLIIDNNTFSTGSIKYTLESTNNDNNGNIIPSTLNQVNISTDGSSITLGNGNFKNATNKVHTYILSLYFPETSKNQNSEQGKTIQAHVEIIGEALEIPIGWDNPINGSLLKAIKDINSVNEAPTTPGQKISSSSEAVLAQAEDDYATSYYFRGNVKNNYVVFAKKCWRIVRVVGDGSIKLVLYNYNPNNEDNPCKTSEDNSSRAFIRYEGETYLTTFNDSSNQNADIGFKYGIQGSDTYKAEHENINNSKILNYLESWYSINLLSYESYLADTIWCNDKSMSSGEGHGAITTYYSTNGRLSPTSTAVPTLACPNDSLGGKLSKFTVDDTTYGNGNLNNKIGLLTADEVAFAGSANNLDNYSFYLYKNASSNLWWSMSPYYAPSGSAHMWAIYKSGYLWLNRAGNSNGGIRPAISLISTTLISEGDGKQATPYVVS